MTAPELKGTWQSWTSMRNRCVYAKPGTRAHNNYAGRGIRVCPQWSEFNVFLADMGVRPEGKTLDRFPDNDGDYEPSNCRWATAFEQAANRRDAPAQHIEWDGQSRTSYEWARITGLNPKTIHARVFRAGWSPERALTTRRLERHEYRHHRESIPLAELFALIAAVKAKKQGATA